MNIVVIGSGISAIVVAKTFLEHKHKVYLYLLSLTTNF